MKTSPDFPRCIGCRCRDCNQNKKTCEEIKKLILKKLDVKMVEGVTVGEELVINYTYTDLGRQMVILDIHAPVIIAGIPWMKPYLE